MIRRSRRPLLLLLTLALAALVVLTIVLRPRGDESPLPAPLQGVFPLPGDAVARQTAIEVDLPGGYLIRFYADGEAVPEDEVTGVESTGRWRWQPGEGWEGGEHVVRIEWDRSVGRPDPGSYEWAFHTLPSNPPLNCMVNLFSLAKDVFPFYEFFRALSDFSLQRRRSRHLFQ